VALAAITSCTNTSNPALLLAAGLVAKKAVEKGLTVPAWVKTSLAPGSQIAEDYLTGSGLLSPLESLGFNIVGYGCTTCIGNSGPLAEGVSEKIKDKDLVVASVVSGNRNFEGRIHADIRANYLASPPLVVAYALAARIDISWDEEPIAHGKDGQEIFLKDIWPTPDEILALEKEHINRRFYESRYADVFKGDHNWQELGAPESDLYQWDDRSTYVRQAPFFDDLTTDSKVNFSFTEGRALAVLGDSITTDHISPAGAIKTDSPAGEYLASQGVSVRDFNSLGSRRGNHEVMMRGTFGNIRLRNLLADGKEGGWTRNFLTDEIEAIPAAAAAYQKAGVNTLVLAGKYYGSGSSRDWAAKGPKLLGIKAVIAESYERIHRSNLVGMGILPLEYANGDTTESLGLTGEEAFSLSDLDQAMGRGKTLKVTAKCKDGSVKSFDAKVRIDTQQEYEYFQSGGILSYVVQNLIREA
jgi:aconitate hydratase